MIAASLTVWLVAAMLLVAGGVLLAVRERETAGALSGVVLVLGGAVVVLAALVRHAVLPVEATVTIVQVIVLGSLLVLLAGGRAPR